jgi:hypothetical protein
VLKYLSQHNYDVALAKFHLMCELGVGKGAALLNCLLFSCSFRNFFFMLHALCCVQMLCTPLLI